MRYETIVTFVEAASWMPASPGNMKFVRQFEIKPANDIHGNVIASWWEMFKAKYGQQHATKEEDAYRRLVLPENIKTIELHNQKYKKGNTGFWMGLNKYSDLTGSMEGQVYRKTGKLISLSEQQFVNSSKAFENLECTSGYIYASFAYIKKCGIKTGEDYPYTVEIRRVVMCKSLQVFVPNA